MPADFEALRGRIVRNQFEFSRHAVDQTILRNVRVREIRQASAGGRIIEDYPDDKYGPSCLDLVRKGQASAVQARK